MRVKCIHRWRFACSCRLLVGTRGAASAVALPAPEPSVFCWPVLTGASGVLVIFSSTDSILSKGTEVPALGQLYEPAERGPHGYTLCQCANSSSSVANLAEAACLSAGGRSLRGQTCPLRSALGELRPRAGAG